MFLEELNKRIGGACKREYRFAVDLFFFFFCSFALIFSSSLSAVGHRLRIGDIYTRDLFVSPLSGPFTTSDTFQLLSHCIRCVHHLMTFFVQVHLSWSQLLDCGFLCMSGKLKDAQLYRECVKYNMLWYLVNKKIAYADSIFYYIHKSMTFHKYLQSINYITYMILI